MNFSYSEHHKTIHFIYINRKKRINVNVYYFVAFVEILCALSVKNQ